MTSTILPRVVPAPEGKPTRAGAIDAQRRALLVARDPAAWTDADAATAASEFDSLADSWDAERSSYRKAPLEDALARGGPWSTGPCVEIGSGTGVLSSLLVAVWDPVICVDVSAAMLSRARTGLRIRADAARLPVASGSAGTVVIGDAPLFAPEVIRVLRPPGTLLWINALGLDAPYYVPISEILAAMQAASSESWNGVGSEALWGSWLVCRPAVP
ncbi:MAG: class I SAM-dependent methyltransferase [Acidimicrobiales bacterium]